ncbi:MAG: GNAT family N-acetyltransferase [Thermoleophilaceae bacterium]|nr:GNAT family N-acetyltransferase [Thermoleophilaceae bacterium]
MSARVWQADEEDVELVAGLLAGFRDHMGKDVPTDDEIRATAAVLLQDSATEFLLAAPDGQDAAAGVCQLRYRLAIWTGTDDCWLEDLFVRSDARRSGLGRALVTGAFERARARGCRRIDLDVNEDNANALALYREMGFTTEPKPPGRTLYVMRRI